MKLLLTDRAIPGLVPETRTTYYDTVAAGLALRVAGPASRHDARARTWYFFYRFQGTREALVLGTYPALSLKAARTRVALERLRLDAGENPAAARRVDDDVYTFAKFVPVFVAFQKGRKKKEWRADEQKITKHLLPEWGPRALAGITRKDCAERLDALLAGGMTSGVNRIQALMSRLFTVALDRQLIEHHPAARLIKRVLETPGRRKLTDTEIRALWAGLTARPGAAADAMKLRLLLGQRGEETAGMRWAELDLEAGIWTLPPERTKNKREHVLGLPPTAWTLLRARRALVADTEPCVFPGLTLRADAHKALAVLHGGTYTWTDLRRTVATRLGELGYGDETISCVQNRARSGITAKVYNLAQYVEMIRATLTAWDTGLTRILAGDPMLDTAARGRVLQMPPREAGLR
jgi:integrase